MNLNKIFTIYKKELLDLLRDRRTVITSFVIPIILYPLIMIGFSSMMTRQELKLDQQEMVIYVHDVLNDENSAAIRENLSEIDNFQVMQEMDVFSDSSMIALVEENSIQALVAVSDSLSSAGYLVFNVDIFYNRSNEKSTLAFEKVRNTLQNLELEMIGVRLSSININEEILNAVEIKEENVAPPEKMVGFALGKFLPYLLIILTISGASVIASDLVAGEKERGTLETILVSAAGRNELVLGKYLTIITISIITVLLNLFSMYISFKHILSQAGQSVQNVQLPLGNFALILVLMLPLITFFSAILLSISTYSRNIKEAQSYQMPLIFGGMMLSMVSFLPGFELNLGFAFIPIVNFSLLIRDIMLSSFDMNLLLIVVGWTLILDVIVVMLSIKLFNNEKVLFRTSDDDSLKFWGKSKTNIFSNQFIMLFYFVILLALYYLGGRWQSADIMNGLIKTQLIIILLPVLLILRVSKTNIKKTLRLNPTKPANFVLALFAIIPALIIVAVISQAINLIFPVSESYMEGMKNFLDAQQHGFWLSIFVIGILPGICEETMFRGFIINGFKKMGFWRSIVISGVLFGVFHLDPFRLLPASLLGMWLGYMLLRTNSIYVPMFAHFVNNSFTIIVTSYGDKIPIIKSMFGEDTIPYWYIAPALLIMFLIYRSFERLNN
jgi:sodium transport system permease protein